MNSECEISASSRAAAEGGWFIWEGRSGHQMSFDTVGVGLGIRVVCRAHGRSCTPEESREEARCRRGPRGEAVAGAAPA